MTFVEDYEATNDRRTKDLGGVPTVTAGDGEEEDDDDFDNDDDEEGKGNHPNLQEAEEEEVEAETEPSSAEAAEIPTTTTTTTPAPAPAPAAVVMSSRPSLTKVIAMARPEWTMIVVALLLMLLSEATNLLLPLIVANAYDTLVDSTATDSTAEETTTNTNQPMDDINYYMTLTLVIYAVGATAGFARGAILGIVGERLVARLRLKVYENTLKQEMAFFDEHKSGELVSRLGSDTTLLQNVIAMSIPEAMIGMIKVVVSIVLMFYISPKLAGLSIGGTFSLCALATPFGFTLARLSKQYQDVLGDAQTHSTEAFGNMRTVQSFAAEKKELNRYSSKIGNPDDFPWWWPTIKDKDKAAATGQKTTYRVGFFKSLNTSSFYSLVFGGGFGFLYVSLWYGFYLVTEGEMTLGDLTAFQSYIFTIGFGLGQTAGHMAQIFAGLGASGRVFFLLERVPQIPRPTTSSSTSDEREGDDDDDKPKTNGRREEDVETPPQQDTRLVPSSIDGDIQFDNVLFTYPSRPDALVLNGFTLRLEKNTTTALVGSSGSGKSTVVSLIQRFYDIDGGTITIDGNDIQSLGLRFLRKHIGYVQQEPQLFGLSVRQNLLYGIDDESSVSQERLERVCKDANAHDFISSWSTGYDTLVGEKGVKLSGGQKQRIAIARALLTNCRVLLLDEATSALDAESEHEVQSAIERAMVGRTVVVVAHRLSTIQSADQIVVMGDNHKIVDVGTHDSLLTNCTKYQDLIKRQSMMTRDMSSGALRSMLAGMDGK